MQSFKIKIFKFFSFFKFIFLGFIFYAFSCLMLFLLVSNFNFIGGKWFNESLIKKIFCIENLNPKIIILSGSNSHFGYSAEIITKNIQANVCNFAIHAGVGSNYIFYYTKKINLDKKIIIMPLEYELYNTNISYSSLSLLHQILGHDMAYFNNLDILHKINFLFNIAWLDRFRLFKQRFLNNNAVDNNLYNSNSINLWGDESNYNLSSVFHINNLNKKIIYSHDDSFWLNFKEFVEFVRKNNGDVYLSYPNIYSNDFNPILNLQFLKDLKMNAAQINVKILGDYNNFIFDESRLFDSKYHQNSYGRSISSEILSDLIVANKLNN